MPQISLIAIFLGIVLTLGSTQVSFGQGDSKTEENVDTRLGLLASTLGVAPVPGASYEPEKGSSFEGDGSFNSGSNIPVSPVVNIPVSPANPYKVPAPGDSYAPVGGVGNIPESPYVPAPGDSYASDGHDGKYSKPSKCECVPKHQCPGGGHNGVPPHNGNGNSYPDGKDPGLTIGTGPNNNPETDGSGVIDIRIVNRPPQGVVCLGGEIYCCNNPTPVVGPGPQNPYSCGVSNIIPVPGYNSEYGQADFGEYPWMAVILSDSNNYLGAGALLDSYHVLTAAHKVKDYKAGYQMKVRLGEWNAQDDSEPHKNVEVEVQGVEIHPGFNSQNLYNDLAIVKLKYPVDIGAYPHIKPVCLPKQGSDFVGKRCWVAGFGKDAFKVGKHSFYLKEVDVPIVESNECEGRLRGTRLGNQFILNRKSFICGGGEAGKDACTGDGGAPLVCKNYDGHFEVVGLVAWGIGCAEGGVPGVYVNVPNYIDWIQAKLY